ncbi:phage integrase family protein [Stutzerimonas stutzeri ATCC 14405 = CCUG 16156]|uniref:site-specific integrase n=1 Tax=Stutzerimonas stutzeri TaxID=316 RepID=UPI0002549447|nr:site-specific integrase [Stutzerimonas stutzeri]EHY75937.1 phage integrase family protein [Stutzerimonas stutzeri ATCC 14405 = CCUG 16156]QOZ96003.1 site-specific integrase [Stutzerimonas stutzeri]
MKYTIKTFKARSGERFSQLYEALGPGLPLFYPTAFIARSVRPAAAHNTQKVYLAAIKRICEWEALLNIDLAHSFGSAIFLTSAQVDDLANSLRARKSGAKNDVIGAAKYNTYVAYAADYLRWLAYEVSEEPLTVETRTSIEAQNTSLMSKKRRRAGSKHAREQRIVTSHLHPEANIKLLELFDMPLMDLKEIHNFGPRFRNIVMIRILYETGMRVGELLSLKLKSFIEAGGDGSAYLLIERNHHDELDTRLHQPVAKTQSRKLPISKRLEEQLSEYLENWRAIVPGVGFSDEDFIFIVHRSGITQGYPLPKSSFEAGLANLKIKYPPLLDIHPHLLRHDWNYRFSIQADRAGMAALDERTLREQLMGWTPDSLMSKIYNFRYIEEKSLEVGLLIASDSIRRPND